MESKVINKFIRISPRKARRVTVLVKGKTVEKALAYLSFTNYSISSDLSKTISSAAANIKMKPDGLTLENSDLFIEEARIDEGPSWPKRFRPGARGRAKPYVKRTCHLTVVVKSKI